MFRRIIVATSLSALAATFAAESEPALPKYFFSHLAGPLGGPGTADGPGKIARFYYPNGIAVNGAGTIFVTDQSGGLLRKLTPAGEVSTLVSSVPGSGSEDTLYPALGGTAVDRLGNVYVADTTQHTIRKIAPDLTVTMLAGAPGAAGDADGVGAAARFNTPVDVAADGAGNVYVADANNHTIRRIAPDGTVTTLAGNSRELGYTDGLGAAARFAIPAGIAVDEAGNIYVADQGASTIRKVTPDGLVSTVAGRLGIQGTADGTGTAAQFDLPRDVAVDGAGNIYVADTNNNSVRKITPAGVTTTLAGTSGPNNIGSADGMGPAAQFHYPGRLAVDRDGNVYVADTENTAIRKITPAGSVSTLAGMAGGPGSTDGSGTTARFCYPAGVAVDAANNVYVCDKNNHLIRKVTPAGVVTTLAGKAQLTGTADGIGSAARFNTPYGIAIDSAGTLFVAEQFNHTIRKITPDGAVTTFAGSAGVAGSVDGTGADARFNEPIGLAFDRAGNLFVADAVNSTVRKITPAGVVTTVAGTAGVYGSADGTGTAAEFYCPVAIAVDDLGNLYVADEYNFTFRKIAPDGRVTTLAGAAGVIGSADGTGANARFGYPYGVAVDRDGNLLVTDGTSTIRRITPAGVVNTLAGAPGVLGSVDGINRSAQFAYSLGIAVSRAGDIILSDYINCAIRRGQLAGPPTIATQPQSLSASPAGSAQFSVTAAGVPNPTYQWFFNGGAIKDMTAATLTLTGVRASDAGDYTVTVSNELGSVTSNKATLTITAAPTNPLPTSPSSSGGNGGGGAPSVWFLATLAMLGALRRPATR